MTCRDTDLREMEIREASMLLSNHLDNVVAVGSERTVSIRRLVKYLQESLFQPALRHTVLFSGSKGEGLNFITSDDDVMLITKGVIVVQSLADIPESDINKTIFVMENTDCKPGYTLLKLHQVGLMPNPNVIGALADINGSIYLSSVVFSSNMLGPGYYQHGPCSTIANRTGSEIDYAYCFHCRSWPDNVSDFRFRTFDCGWPSRQLVNYIVRNGCHCVAIGDKHSSLFAMQWRISFAKAEKSLVMSFNHVQLKTYALLKIFLKECIERDESIKDLLCSYFIKTIVFHAIEHSMISMWVDENIVQCFWYCFTILLEFVQTGYCPNYFVLTHNMFLSNVTGDNRRRLLRVLSRYNGMGWTCLFQCSSLQTLFQFSNLHQSREAECVQDKYIYYNLVTCDDADCGTATVLKLVNRVFLKCSDDNQCDTALLFLINAITNISSNAIADLTRTHNNSNKNVYRQIGKNKRFLHLSSATDVCYGLLTLATFYYNVGCYTNASDVATRVVFACQQGALLQVYGDFTEYNMEIWGKGYTLLQKTKRSFVIRYTIYTRNTRLYPPELDPEVQTSTDRIHLPPLPYAVFLLVLSAYRRGNIGQSWKILDDLMAARTNEIYGVRLYPILHNLVGICHTLLGDTRRAIRAFEESCRELPDNPAAANRIAELRRHQRDNTNVDALDYCNVPCHYQNYESIDNDDDDRLYYHKTMYNTDPVSFVNLSWF